jgi:hypothetical protein
VLCLYCALICFVKTSVFRGRALQDLSQARRLCSHNEVICIRPKKEDAIRQQGPTVYSKYGLVKHREALAVFNSVTQLRHLHLNLLHIIVTDRDPAEPSMS